MQTYQIKVLPRSTFLYGGSEIKTGNDSEAPVLILKNDRFGEAVSVVLQRQKPTQPVETIDLGILGADEALSVNLQFVLRVEAKTIDPNLDSLISCTIAARSSP